MNNTSFRDPCGFVFKKDDVIYRQINLSAKDDYDYLMNSGLYTYLTEKNFLVTHEEIDLSVEKSHDFYKFIKPQQLQNISYPYEWAFSALKDSALLTLKIQKIALKYEMSLKDASAYNVQFLNGKTIFIDTLSFEKYIENTPWKAYGQFCRHFLAPLALMSFSDISLNKLLITNIDGISLDVTSKLLPLKSKLNFGIFTHIFLHSLSQKTYENEKQGLSATAKMSKNEQLALIESLIDTVKSLKFPKIFTEWGNYYQNTNYSDEAAQEKYDIISNYINIVAPKSLCDLGANRGDFSRISSNQNIPTIAFDIDPVAVEDNYLYSKRNSESFILPLIQDLTNPSPAIGFMNNERADFISRFKCDTVMALALIHHLAISNNLPFENLAVFFGQLGENLIIEFVPKEDSKVQVLLSSREDIFVNYNQEEFEKVFAKYFEIVEKTPLKNSLRTMYLMRKK